MFLDHPYCPILWHWDESTQPASYDLGLEMGNSGMALLDPQGQPKHAEYHRVGYPHQCHWIIILKVIVQDSIISGILVAKTDQMEGHENIVLTSPLLHHSDTMMKAL